jgi:hypothetical protein
MKGNTPSKEEKKLHDRIAALGCIACRLDGISNTWVSIHHIAGRTKPGAHRQVLALCGPHHQTGGEEAPAIHPWKARFEAKYGTQAELLAMTMELIAHNADNAPDA